MNQVIRCRDSMETQTRLGLREIKSLWDEGKANERSKPWVLLEHAYFFGRTEGQTEKGEIRNEYETESNLWEIGDEDSEVDSERAIRSSTKIVCWFISSPTRETRWWTIKACVQRGIIGCSVSRWYTVCREGYYKLWEKVEVSRVTWP